ncbi:MAG: hypoxanthine phosphoribosyltransferase [Liquorilactobacillus nagelii]|jgi:hypoxanthine phosphoribosyltransferase|uniref:Hypoxanthine phosphoribosyltransferase n=1 Tax=Liquorilactobacillus nagelii TaxID=82688 RepID=A0A3S6QTH3_9LACO|nr:hypoxanthine phosphoribosyltransferase [Liquorilactobacillus nagelii]AUJ31442.1 hypoxanthine phosphoribosyltransferase [Liquorilactobacillus nagelii]KRL41292.1 hypoxanthine-guanine phosphoribosyltransferase [Liquorilactobacillus nagelii DSM 13675]MCC7617098.1 hypoxanthine phosphoribosyltransferase [Liquorilactobacillus nagelii]MCI1633352.1 hypoxanthine phosphoribosyltransferase [Liquorilactobacillus nagelii]MCI1700168.1 hypoxanthine phosphoribosyltransferase [Liquorilactobacillus nagelii]
MNSDIKEILYSQEQIQRVCQELGAKLTNDYQDKKPLVICVLKGAVMFMADIVRKIDTYIELDFMDVSSYGNEMESSGSVKIIKDLDVSVKGRDVLIVEDIIDTGRTLACLASLLKHRQAKSVKICTLLDKPDRREKTISPDYVGFQVPNEFVVGYGLDYQGFYRNLPYVGILKPAVYEKN